MKKAKVPEKGLTNRRSLAEVEAMYGSLIETLPAIVYVAEAHPPYSAIYVSPNIAGLGFPHDKWLEDPKRWVSVIHPDDREWVLAQTAHAMETGGSNRYEYRVIAADGSTHWLDDRGKFVLDEHGAPVCWQGVMLDITTRKEAEADRERLIGELQRALREVKTLSGLLPICASCKKVRDDTGYWRQIEVYIKERSDAEFTHGICPDCSKRLYGAFLDE